MLLESLLDSLLEALMDGLIGIWNCYLDNYTGVNLLKEWFNGMSEFK